MTENKIALVTGANKGIGKEIARQLGGRGLVVYAAARNEERGRRAVAELAHDGDVRYVGLDATDESSIAAAAKQIDADVGRLDVLVNNAGVSYEQDRPPIDEITAELLRRTYEVNVFGVVAVTSAMLPLLRRSRSARVVNVSSFLGSMATVSNPDHDLHLVAYNSSKSALNALTLAYAHELRGEGIHVNAVSPGFVATDMTRHAGVLTPEQGAGAPVRLATTEAPETGKFVAENGEELPW